MTKSVAKFPIWIIIAIGLVFAALIVGIILILKVHNTYYTYREDAPPVGFIVTIVITAVIAIANLILVGFTKLYADQTKEMAEATKAMVDYYNTSRTDDLKPLFIPLKHLTDAADNITFKFANVGNLALYVNTEVVQTGNRVDYPYRDKGQEIIMGPLNFSETVICAAAYSQSDSDQSELTFHISFQDKNGRKFRQVIYFYFEKEKWKFLFDESSQPEEQKRNHDPT